MKRGSGVSQQPLETLGFQHRQRELLSPVTQVILGGSSMELRVS